MAKTQCYDIDIGVLPDASRLIPALRDRKVVLSDAVFEAV